MKIFERFENLGRSSRRLLALLIAAALYFTNPIWAVETIDQVLAVVDQNPILQSDLTLMTLVGAGSSANTNRVQQGHDPLDARIRLELHYLDLVASGALQRLEIDITQQLQLMTSHMGSDQRLREALPEYGLEWEDVEALALRIAAVQAWIDHHLRSRVTVTIRDVEQAYEKEVAEPMRIAGETPPPLTQVNERLRQLVAEEKLNIEIRRWSDQTRERHQVTRFVR